MIKFWGVRGSIPCPLTPNHFRNKISSIIQRVRPKDLETPHSRELFLSQLPQDLFGMIGGNTTCIEIYNETQDVILIDAGTGIRELGLNLQYPPQTGITIHIFMTHFHWDHIQGLPFFNPFFNPKNTINFYSPIEGFETFIRDQMKEPYFPVPLSIFPATINFIQLKTDFMHIGDTKISWRQVNHPGGCASYRFDEDGHSFVFSTDTELKTSDFIKTESNFDFYENIDLLVMDAQYTLGEAVEKINWGHTSYSLAIDFALEYNIKKLLLFHHEPNYTDSKVEEIGRLAGWYVKHNSSKSLELDLAREGMEVDV